MEHSHEFQKTESWESFARKRTQFELERQSMRAAFIEYVFSYVQREYNEYLQGPSTPWKDNPNDGDHQTFAEYLQDSQYSGDETAYVRYLIPDFEETIMGLYENSHEFCLDVNIYLMTRLDDVDGEMLVASTVVNQKSGALEMVIK